MVTSTSKNAGFTLVELLAGTTIFAVIMALLLQMLNVFEAKGDLDVTKNRLETIAEKAGEYYLSRENLPVPTPTPEVATPMGEVPLTEFHLDAKYRIDPWGRPIQYFSVRNDGAEGRVGEVLIDPLSTVPSWASVTVPDAMVTIEQADLEADPPTGRTLIDGVWVNGRNVAGVLISSGPNGVFEYNNDTPPAADAFPVPFTLDAGSDDIIVPIDLNLQATRIAQAELKKLGEKVRAFDDRYIGKNNDGDGEYDENACAGNSYPGSSIYTREITARVDPAHPEYLRNAYNPIALNNPDTLDACRNFPFYPGANYLPNDGNDYSCGRPTLDNMQEEFCDTSGGNCPEGYYLPDENQIGFTYTRDEVWVPGDPDDPDDPGEWEFVRWIENEEDCGNIGADYFRVPMDRGNPDADDCHWGLVGNPTVDPSLLTNDQARAFIFCVYSLSPADIVDPWLNGYVWGSWQEYPDPDPRYHKFFSAGPDETVNTDDDIVAPL